MPEGTVLLLISSSHDRCNLVIAVGRLLQLWLHLLLQLRRWGDPIDDVQTKHLKDISIGEWLALVRKDVALLPSIIQHCLGI